MVSAADYHFISDLGRYHPRLDHVWYFRRQPGRKPEAQCMGNAEVGPVSKSQKTKI